MSVKETTIGIRISREEKENINKEAKKFKLSISDYSRRVLRIGTEKKIVKEDFVSHK
ncbi:MAG: hypothetical protein P4L45_12380 [Ignavibacteriaceae bacterium]|nr:hypothetical protein [Ignavibacteriaceae bacterium]